MTSFARTFPAARQTARRGTPSLAARLLGLLGLRRQHAALARLDDRLLSDIGVTRDEAEAELRRTLWNPPGHWRN